MLSTIWSPRAQRWRQVQEDPRVQRPYTGGYGFASPVLYILCHQHMKKHNPELETMLRYPAFHVDMQGLLVTELAAVQYCMCMCIGCMCCMHVAYTLIHFLLSSSQ